MANALLLKPLPIVAATAPATGKGDPLYVGNDYAGVVWASTDATVSALIVDLGSDQRVDMLMLFGVLAPAGATLDVYAATEAQGSGFGAGAFYASPGQLLFAGNARLSDGAGVSLWSAPADGRPAVRYLRLRFGTPAGGIVQIGRVVAGKALQLERNFSFGAGIGVRDLGSLDFTRLGVLIRKRGKKLRTLSVSFSSVRKDEVESAVQPLLEQVGNTEPVALITDPAPDDMRERRCFFGPFVGDLQNVWRNAVAFEWKPNVVSLF